LSGGLEIDDDIVLGHAPQKITVDWLRRLVNVGTTPSLAIYSLIEIGKNVLIFIII
jgi:hypothetical protein